jgi:hypothetical protein
VTKPTRYLTLPDLPVPSSYFIVANHLSSYMTGRQEMEASIKNLKNIKIQGTRFLKKVLKSEKIIGQMYYSFANISLISSVIIGLNNQSSFSRPISK